MATFDSLAGDQRAVLQLVLARRRGYEEIASMLSIGPEEVRRRALAALDALGPPTELDAGERQLICDYLLSQLPETRQSAARELVASSSAARAWAVALTPALEPVAVDPLPRIPPAATPSAGAVPTDPATAGPVPAGPAAAGPVPAGPTAAANARPPSSRRGGFVVIGLAAAVIIAAVVVLLITRHPGHRSGRFAADTRSTTTPPASATTTSSTTSAVKAVAQINLRPVSAPSKAVGVVVVVRQGATLGIEMFGEHIPPNTRHNSYEVWLYSSPTRFEKLGFVSPAVGKNGRFAVVQVLPKNAATYRQLIVTTETAQKPTHPGSVLLRGTITGLS